MSTVSGRTVAEWTLRAGRRLQDDVADLVRSALAGEPDLGRRAWRFLLTTAEESATGAALFIADEEARGAWLELRNKVEAFRAFEHVDALLGMRVEDHAIGDLSQRATRLEPPLSVWAAEGVGYHATAARCRGSVAPRNLLVGSDALPSWLLIPLHAGMGSALTVHVLDRVRADPGRVRLDAAIGEFQALCTTNADMEHRDVALEALGFVARSMFGELLPSVTTCVRSTRPPLASLLWHGVGRAMYFAPTAALPLSDTRRRVLDELAAVASQDAERANTVAGFAWAATLVNLRDPSVLEPFAVDVARLQMEQAFARGVHDALAVWSRCAPDDGAAAAFRSHEPRARGRRDAWMRLMSAADARRVHDAGELFHVPGDGVGDA